MKIARVEVWPVTMKLAEPYTIAYESVDSATNVFIRVDTDREVVGFGCAAPDEPVTGETPETALHVLSEVAGPWLVGQDPLRHARLLEDLAELIPAAPSARAAVDMAVFDILGKTTGLPVWRLLGGYRTRIKTSVTIGILSVDETVERVRGRVADGFRCIKLKGGARRCGRHHQSAQGSRHGRPADRDPV